MVWAKTDPSTWTDEFAGAEKVFYAMSQAFKRHNQEHGSVYAICRISVRNETTLEVRERLRQAWTRLRLEFPALTVFENGGKKTYLEPTAATIQMWVDNTFWFDEDTDSARHVVNGLHLRTLPCLIFVVRSSEVLFHCSHWRIDALGTCMMLDRLFSILSELPPEDLHSTDYEMEHKHLSPSLEDAYGSTEVPTPSTEAKAEGVRQRNFDTSYPSAGLPCQGDPFTGPGDSRWQKLVFEKDASAELIRACKARSFTITAAVHAACAASVFECCTAADTDAYSTVVSVNLRPFLPKDYTTCGTYVTGITHTLRRGDDFASWCRQLTVGYRAEFWGASEYMEALRSIYQVHGKAMNDRAASGTRPAASNVTISSLGLLDGKYLRADHGVVQVEDFHLGSAIMSRQPTLYIWTFNGCLTLSVDYNEAYYSESQISALLMSIKSHLGKELRVAIGGILDA